MRLQVLACDYDGTLATEGRVCEPTLHSLQRIHDSGRQLVLVTGREFLDLANVFPQFALFDWIVGENGAHLYRPMDRAEILLGTRLPPKFVAALRQRGVAPLSVGRVIAATREPHQTAVLNTIHDHGLELQVIFNKGAVMILPSGVNKATGLVAALRELNVAPQHVVGVGDAENDHSFLAMCGFSVAVANALPTLKEAVDFVTCGSAGAGVAELIDLLLANKLCKGPPVGLRADRCAEL